MAESVDHSANKRSKYDQSSDFDSDFKEFSSSSYLVEITSRRLEDIHTGDFSFRLLKIENCNANEGCCFSQAFCKTRSNIKTHIAARGRQLKTLDAYRLSTIFSLGTRLLTNFLCDSQIPEGVGEKTALKRLVNTLLNLESIRNCLRREQSNKESNWTLALAKHLLRSLAVNKSFLIDSRYGDGKYMCEQDIGGKLVDTSIGCTSVWHGFVDLILGTEIPIVTADGESNLMDRNQSVNEDKSGSELSSMHRQQIIAQTIVFSFLQKKEQNDYGNYLIPCIGVSKNHITIFMYDCELDILLESADIKLFSEDGDTIYETGVLALWLAVNYRFTCSGVTQHMIESEFFADFPKHVGKKIETYQKNVKFGCGLGKRHEKFVPAIFDVLNLH